MASPRATAAAAAAAAAVVVVAPPPPVAKKDAEIQRLRELVEEQERQIREMKKAMY